MARVQKALKKQGVRIEQLDAKRSLGLASTLLAREGRPLDANIGNAWKVAYHSGRSVLECVTRLRRLEAAF